MVANLTGVSKFDDPTAQADQAVAALGMGAFGPAPWSRLLVWHKNPWKPVVPTIGQKGGALDIGLDPRYRARRLSGARHPARRTDHRSSKCARGYGRQWNGDRFPWRESGGDSTTVESHHKFEIAMGIHNPVMLIPRSNQ